MDTSLDDIALAGRQLRSHSPQDWPLAIAALSERLDRELEQPAALGEVARQVAQVAHRLHCEALAGASPLGTRIARASVANAMNGLRMFDGVTPATTVLIVEGILASGVQAGRAARSARSAGVAHTPAVALLADPIALERCREVFSDEVIALREL
jgi:hypothetical protein